jgi:predicted DNA-binding transcriptional regulator AlpA
MVPYMHACCVLKHKYEERKMEQKYQSDIYLSWSEVQRIAGNKSRTTIWRWMRDGLFPSSYKIGANSVAWKASELQLWVDSHDKGVGSNV